MAKAPVTTRPVDLTILYDILVRTAERRTTMTYRDLSDIYSREIGGDWRSPRTWGDPLGQINIRLHERNLPAISAVAVHATDGLPGDGFWGCCGRGGGVPEKPESLAEANRLWSEILDRVYATTDWPFAL
jgi:hypothetical protein